MSNQIRERAYKNFPCQPRCEARLYFEPLLFNIYLADLPDHVSDAHCNPIKGDEINHNSCIAWADDIVLLSETEEGLQCMLDKLTLYCEKNRMQINIDKTKAMIFNRTGKHIKRSFNCGKEKIFTTNSYKYLGFVITPSGDLTSGLTDLKNRAQRLTTR